MGPRTVVNLSIIGGVFLGICLAGVIILFTG